MFGRQLVRGGGLKFILQCLCGLCQGILLMGAINAWASYSLDDVSKSGMVFIGWPCMLAAPYLLYSRLANPARFGLAKKIYGVTAACGLITWLVVRVFTWFAAS